MLQKNIARFVIFLLVMYAAVSCGHGEHIDEDRAKKGELLFNNTGCPKCHSVSGESLYGPPLNRISGGEAVIIRNGSTLTVKRDRRYIIRSLEQPEAEKPIDYKDKIMPPVNLSGKEIEQIADYLMYINSANH